MAPSKGVYQKNKSFGRPEAHLTNEILFFSFINLLKNQQIMANKKIIHGESKTQVKNNVQKPKKNGRGHRPKKRP